MIIELQKLWLGKFVSARDYQVAKCIKNKKSITWVFNNDKMTLTAEQLEKTIKFSNKENESKYNAKQKYTLRNFPWKPDSVGEFASLGV